MRRLPDRGETMRVGLVRIEAPDPGGPANRRRDPRTIVEVGATVISARGEQAPITIANISVHGCNITGDAPWLRLGQFVTIRLAEGQPMQGIVRWTRDGSAGLEFMRAVPQGHAEWHALIDSIANL
jgi:hypothetical protein